jgi:CHAT domain-containing protein
MDRPSPFPNAWSSGLAGLLTLTLLGIAPGPGRALLQDADAFWAPRRGNPVDGLFSRDFLRRAQDAAVGRSLWVDDSGETLQADPNDETFAIRQELERLVRGTRSYSKSADLWSDLGALWLEAARLNIERAPLIEGLAAVRKALEIDPQHEAAAFNEALLLATLPLPRQARIAWERFLMEHDGSAWADTARRQLELLRNRDARRAQALTPGAEPRGLPRPTVTGLPRSRVTGDVRQEALSGWLVAQGALEDGKVAEARERYSRTRELLAQLADPLEFALSPLIAETEVRLGNKNRAWEERLRDLPRLAHGDYPLWAHNGLFQIIEALELDGRGDVAEPFIEELVAKGEEAGIGGLLAEILDRKDKSSPEAAPYRDEEEAEAAVLERAAKALRLFELKGQADVVPRLGYLRALTTAARGESLRAGEEIEKAIGMMDDRRRASVDERHRILYFAKSQKLYEDRIALALENGDIEDAFWAADAPRARDLLARDPSQDGKALEIQAGTVLLELTVLAEKLVIFRWDARGLSVEQTEIRREDLDQRIADLVRHLAADRAEAKLRPLLAAFYDLILRRSLRAEDQVVVIVPDGASHELPFAGFFDRDTQRYVAETRQVIVAPNAEVARRRLRGETRPLRGDSLLALGNPAASGLPRLPGSEREVRAIQQHYPKAKVLIDTGATSWRLLAALEQRPAVVHLSAHAQLDRLEPRRSVIFLADQGAEPTAVTAGWLREKDLRGIEVVVLAACATLTTLPAATGREGLGGWARTFIGQGVPVVVVTLWPVDDGSGSMFSIAFHQALREGRDVAAAMTAAQRSLIHSSDERERSPARWAVFQLIETN